jgi:hypothetical protein
MAAASLFPCRLPALNPVSGTVPQPPSDEFASNPCKVRMAGTRYRNDPYRAVVTVSKPAHISPPPEFTEEDQQPPARPPVGAPSASFRRGLPPRGTPLPALQVAAPHPPAVERMDIRRPAASIEQHHLASAHAAQTTTTVPVPVQTTSEALPAASSNDGQRPGQKIALIKFKRNTTSAVYDPEVMAGVEVGSFVMVEGDRGEHIAQVVRTSVKKSKSTPTIIHRFATEADLHQLQLVREDEAIALETCRSHATRLGLDAVMTIADVEFQLDFQKLTVFFTPHEANAFVDFRGLQRILYQHFRCRIWIVDW